MISKKKMFKFLYKYVFKPDIAFLIYFIFVALFGLSGRQLLFVYGMIFPWLLLLVIFMNIPFLNLLFRGVSLTETQKMNHVLEHGTIYFLKKQYKKKAKIGGKALKYGFRIYGDVESKKDIYNAFVGLQEYLAEGKNAAVLSRFCGSNISILEGFAIISLTITFIAFIFINFSLLHVQIILLGNCIIYLLLKIPIGKYFQKKLMMSFNFKNAQIESVKKTKKKGLFEKNPVYLIKTIIN